jgi:hypothetical protein
MAILNLRGEPNYRDGEESLSQPRSGASLVNAAALMLITSHGWGARVTFNSGPGRSNGPSRLPLTFDGTIVRAYADLSDESTRSFVDPEPYPVN